MKRFRAFLTDAPEPGAKLLLDPGAVTEEWEADQMVGNVPVPAVNDEPRIAYIVRIIGRRATEDHRGRRIMDDPKAGLWEVICEDPPPFQTTVGALLTVAVGPILCPPRELGALLDYLAGGPLVTDEQRAAVADQCATYLWRLMPLRLRDAIEWIDTPPTFETPAEYAAWVAGIAVATGCHYGLTIPRPNFTVTIPPDRILGEETRMLNVRDDAAEQIRRHHRAN